MAALYTDHDFALEVSIFPRGAGHIAIAAHDLKREEAGDDEQLLTAAQHAWTLVTHNRKDFTLLHNAWRRWARAWGVVPVHAGILVLPRGSPSSLAERVSVLFESNPPLTNALYTWKTGVGWSLQRGEGQP
ncbi:MAG TPA: DUF5615 family PIN-like protein [Chloroflexota bacterium]|nr:DUF5615 family PIN-like protein [Chloroflexota bacterium]